MAYSTLLGLLLPDTGSLTGTWGTAVNDQITSLTDSAVAGTTTLSTDADVTLTDTQGVANQARQAILLCTGARTVTRNITAPARSKAYIVVNATTGGQAVVIRGAGPTSGVSVANGTQALVAWTGSDFSVIVASQVAVGNITGLGSGVATFLATPSSANLAAAVSDETGTGALVFGTSPTLNSPTLVTPALGTPSSGTLTNATGLPISTGVSGLGTGVATALATNVGTAGGPVVNGGALGTPSSATLTNAAGLPISTGVSGLGTGVATALATNVGTAGGPVVNGGALGTPSSGTLTNATGLPISTGVSGLGANVATFLATPTSANLAAAVTGETGSGALVFNSSPALSGPQLSGAIVTGALNGSGASYTTNTNLTLTNEFDNRVTLTGNITITAPSTSGNMSIMYVRVKQDATGGRTLAWSGVTWPGGVAPTMSSGANKSDLYFLYKDAGNTWFGAVIGQNY